MANQTCLAEIKDLLKAIHNRAVEGSIIRSKEQWIELGEKPTKYFNQLKNKRQSHNVINALRVGNLSVTWTKDILRECHAFYCKLYSAEPVDLPSQDWLLVNLHWLLTWEDQQKCEGLLALSECYEALGQMSSGKLPGADGLLVEFYRHFWGLIGQDLVDTLNYSFTHGALSNSQRLGIIHLIFKKNDPLKVKN